MSAPIHHVAGIRSSKYLAASVASIVALLAFGLPAPAQATNNFACYKATATSGTPRFVARPGISLVDRIRASTVAVKKPKLLCAPTSKNGEQPGAPSDPDHLEDYQIKPAGKFTALRNRKVTNQFGAIVVDVLKPVALQVPTAKDLDSSPAPPSAPAVDHFSCYSVKVSGGTPAFVPVSGVQLEDQFGSMAVRVLKPQRLCAPTNKNNEEPGAESHPDQLMCYRIAQSSLPKFATVPGLFTNNQFGPERLDARVPAELCVPTTIGVDYYVDAGAGSDGASGNQPSTAWRSISRVNSATFQPGDRVLFKRGGVWREQLTINDSGESGSPIVFGSYGTGDAPVVWGADCVSAACDPGPNRWSPVGGSDPIYQAAVSWKAGVFLADGQPLRFVAWTSSNPADMWARMSPGSYTFDHVNRVGYVWMPDGSSPDGHVVEAARRDNDIYTTGAHDVRIEGLALRASAMDCVQLYNAVSWTFDDMDVRYCGGRFKDEDPNHTFYFGNGITTAHGTNGVLIKDSKFGDVFDSGISVQLYASPGSAQNVTIENSETFNTPLAGIEIPIWSNFSTIQGVTIRNSNVHDAGRGWSMPENPNRIGTGITSWVGPGLQSTISGVVIQDNTIANNLLDGVVLAYDSGSTRIERNTITGNDYGIAFYDDQSTTSTGGVVLDNDNSGNSETGLCFYVPNSSTGLQAIGNTAPAFCPATLAQHVALYQ